MTKMVRTLEALSTLGWQGINNSDDPVELVVDTWCKKGQDYRYDMGVFNEGGSTWAPTDAVAICRKLNDPYEHSAALDTIAHEVGHGVIFASTGIPYGGTVAKQFHEGFADFIAYAVEWYEGDESAQEQPDWTFGEDVRDPAPRGVEDADEDDETGDDPYCYHINEAWSYCHSPLPYYKGNLLPVAYRLAVEGGKNPICLNNDYPSQDYPDGLDCEFSVDPYTGYFNVDLPFATKIFFRILTVYMDGFSEWDDIADYGKMAAADIHAHHPPSCYDGLPEQQVIFDALMTVGIDGNPDWWDCTCVPECWMESGS